MVGPGKPRLGFTTSALSGHAPWIPDTRATLGLCSAVTTYEYAMISCIGSSRITELGVSPEGAASANGLSHMWMNASDKELLGLRDGRDEYLLTLESAAPPTNGSRDVPGSEQ
ncbi:hypothetical protein BDR07DRAFT_1401389 [Suillus spraguei]|nr:hypothetical protein BDR07DRAFT_1401389 [Suillus spraguei]